MLAWLSKIKNYAWAAGGAALGFLLILLRLRRSQRDSARQEARRQRERAEALQQRERQRQAAERLDRQIQEDADEIEREQDERRGSSRRPSGRFGDPRL